jgi:1,4-alpha-glucan branching enzyme
LYCHCTQALALIGEFNAWDPQPEHWAIKNDFGVWNLFLPDKPDGTPAIQHRWGWGSGGWRLGVALRS